MIPYPLYLTIDNRDSLWSSLSVFFNHSFLNQHFRWKSYQVFFYNVKIVSRLKTQQKSIQYFHCIAFRQSLVDVGGVWNIVDRQRPLQTFNIQWENVIITSLYSVLMFLSVTGNTIALYVLTLGRYILQGVPYYWAHFLFAIFSASGAHTEELFIVIG